MQMSDFLKEYYFFFFIGKFSWSLSISSFHSRVAVSNLEWFIMTVRLHLGQAQELAFLVTESPLSHRECDYTR